MTEAQTYLDLYYPKENKGNGDKIRSEIIILNLNKKNLTGTLDLSDFVNLEDLDCSLNRLTKLILPSSIISLNCARNQLTKLDLTNCSNLEELRCFVNQLTVLLLPKPNHLTEIKVANNYLTSFDYKKLNDTTLTNLSLWNNKLPATDIEKFSHLVNLIDLQIGNDDDFIEKNDHNEKFFGSLRSLKYLEQLKGLNVRNTNISKGLEYLPEKLVEINYIDFRGSPLAKILAPYKGRIKAWKEAEANAPLIKKILSRDKVLTIFEIIAQKKLTSIRKEQTIHAFVLGLREIISKNEEELYKEEKLEAHIEQLVISQRNWQTN